MHMSSKQVAWRDLWAIVIYFLAQIILGNVFSLFLIPSTQIPVAMALLIVGILTSIFVIIYLAWSHRHGLKTKITVALMQSRKHIKLMISVYVLYMIANMIFTYVLQLLPEQWQFKETGNQEALMAFFPSTGLVTTRIFKFSHFDTDHRGIAFPSYHYWRARQKMGPHVYRSDFYRYFCKFAYVCRTPST